MTELKQPRKEILEEISKSFVRNVIKEEPSVIEDKSIKRFVELKRPEKTILDFKQNVLENDMFSSDDKAIIQTHLANFACVYGLGKDAREKEVDSFLSQIASELEEARRLRVQVYKWKLDGLVKQALEKENYADAIEDEVIRALRGK